MDQDMRENLNTPPEQDPVRPRPRKAKKPLRKLRLALRRAYQRSEPARARLVDWRNRFCRAVRGAFDSVAALFVKLWAVVGPVCKKIGRAIAAAAKAVWKVIGPALTKLWQWAKPGILFLGDKIKAGASFLATRFKGLNKAMQIGVGAVSASLVLLIIALMVSAHVSRTAMKAAMATPESVLPVVTETEAPTAAPTATPVPEPLLGEIMKKGDDSPTVAIVQTRLMELGYMDSDEPTEHFGSITEAALIRFQKHNDLKADGQIGETTWNLLMNEGVPECVMQDGDEGDDVQDVQNRLYELGYLAKNYVTGTYGEKTAAAVTDFQKANSIATTGMVGHDTLDVLYADDVVGNFFSKGEVSDTIATYQEKLKKLGYLVSDYKVKGKMDDATIAAIRKFQDNNDLTPDGCLGPTTMSAMDSKDAKSYTLTLGMKGSDVKAVQKRLKALGYLKTNSQVNGYYGEETEDAVEQFQKRNNLSADGTVGPKTLEKLNSSSAKKAHPQGDRQAQDHQEGHGEARLEDHAEARQGHGQAHQEDRHGEARGYLPEEGRGEDDRHRREQDRLPLLRRRQGPQQVRLLRLRLLLHEAGGVQRRLHDQPHLAHHQPLQAHHQHEPDPAGRHPGVQGQLHGHRPRGHLPGRRPDDRRQLRRGPGPHHQLRPLRHLLEAALFDGV